MMKILKRLIKTMSLEICHVKIMLVIFSLQENDYIDSYFDNGEDFAAASDDNMDGEATY